MIRSPLFSGLLVVVLIAVLWFGIWPLYTKVTASRAEVQTLKASIEEEKVAIARIEELTQRIDERRDDIAKLEQAIPQNKDLASLIAVFEEASSINGLQLTEIAFTNRPQSTDMEGSSAVFSRAEAELQLLGTYSSFRTLLSDVERSFPLMDIREITFEPEDEEDLGPSAQFKFMINVQTYHLEE